MERGKKFFRKHAAACLLAAGVIIFSITAKGFLTGRNIGNLLSSMSIFSLLAVGMLFALIPGGVDFSVGAVGALAGVLAAYGGLWLEMRIENVPAALTIVLLIVTAVVTGIAAGACVGYLVGQARLPSVICTLALLYIIRGLTSAVAGGQPVYVLSDHFAFLGTARIIRFGSMTTGLLPVDAIFAALAAAAAHIFLTRTAAGGRIFAVGKSEKAARTAGINTRKTILVSCMICSVFAALAGVIYASRYQNGHPSAMDGYEMFAIPAALLGGASLRGGCGSAGGAVLGAAVVAVLKNGMDLMQVPTYWQKTVMGLLILTAVLVDTKGQSEKQGEEQDAHH